MKALSIRQPWAWAIVTGCKDVENRTWYTNYRGPLLVHASKRRDPAGDLFCRKLGLRVPEALPMGALVGQVQLVDVVSFNKGRSQWFQGPLGFWLKDARAFKEPIPYKGRLGLFGVPQ